MSKQSTQDRVLEALQARIEAAGWEWVRDPQCANTGTIGAAGKDEPIARKRVRYDFQSGYASFKVPGTSDSVAFLQYDKPDRSNHELDKVVEYLIG